MPKHKEKWKVYKNVFSEFSLRTLFKLSSEGHFEELISPIALGKEANIFTALTKDEEIVIIKIYRLENCNFNKMYLYIAGDPRYSKLSKQRRATVFSWVQREYKNLMIAREKIRVPAPITFKNNILIMEKIGDPAPMLKDSPPKNSELFLESVAQNIMLLQEAGLVHGDLSEFNILNHDETPVFIDFSQSTLTKSPNAQPLFHRDLKNIIRFFNKYLSEEKTLKVLQRVKFL